MKVAFAGTPEFAAAALEAILAAGFDVPLVLTQPDRPAGRGMQLQPSPVKRVALAAGIPVHQPEKLRTPEQQAPLAAASCDVTALQRNMEFGRKYKITGTPTVIFSNNVRVPGAISAAEVEKHLAAAK